MLLGWRDTTSSFLSSDEEEAERGKIMFYRSARGHVCNQSLGVIRAFTAMLRFTCRCVFWPEVYFTQDQCESVVGPNDECYYI